MMHQGCFKVQNENGTFILVDEKSLFDVIDCMVTSKLKREFDERNRAKSLCGKDEGER